MTDRTSVELFAGGGGLAMAVHKAGFRPLLLNEFARHACDTLLANNIELRGEEERIPERGDKWPLVPGDVQDLKMGYLQGRVDVLAGGPPCQPFSLGGVAKGDEDKRNMFPEMFRAVREIQPKVVICENVRGLLRASFKPYFDYIVRELGLPFLERDPESSWESHDKALRETEIASVDPTKRYDVVMTPVNAADYGVPQIRNRVIIVAFRADLGVDLDTFKALIRPTHSEAALHGSIRDGRYWKRHPGVPDHVRARVEAALPDVLPGVNPDDGLLPWRTLRDALKGGKGEKSLPDIPEHRLDRQEFDEEKYTYHVGWPDARIYPGHTPNVLDRPAKTVKAGVHGVPGGESVMLTDELVKDPTSSPDGYRYRHRYMTVRETARVMTFPDRWKLSGPRGEKMRQLGNAVPVALGKVFADAVAKCLDGVAAES
ncbi:DNA cytosine methyltransferase [Actinokineospora auranticolor]|uniref:DNA (cytosine-5-)-methyltransferase n=1 Tax=Actinokineospora auranticolor TaxID=155976 RepID=A0A2S6H180_9PSEU|nr:DNA cytosine methyltransferase [Actinokineospora auranticolor]PPK71180.1 DNA (cytosine-5)-methyltransferase 1 [Actinokineospora auranticolor]